MARAIRISHTPKRMFRGVNVTSSSPPETTNYRELAGAMRGLVPAMKHQEARGDLQRLSADYDRLAEFANARRRAARAHERRLTLATFATHRAMMDTLFDEFENAVADARCLQAQFMRTELELGFTFLECATTARGLPRSHRNIRNALLALNTVNRFLASGPRLDESDEIYQRRNQLRRRLHECLSQHEP